MKTKAATRQGEGSTPTPERRRGDTLRSKVEGMVEVIMQGKVQRDVDDGSTPSNHSVEGIGGLGTVDPGPLVFTAYSIHSLRIRGLARLKGF